VKRWLKICLPFFCSILLVGVGAFVWFQRQELLTAAAAAGNLTAVRILYFLGADLNGSTTDDDGEEDEPALCAAVENDHEDVVRFFIEHHANLDIDFADEVNPLSLALKNYSMAKLLLSNGANVHDVTYCRRLKQNTWKPPLDDKIYNLLKTYEHPVAANSSGGASTSNTKN